MAERWSLQGAILGPCNCDWGCPCNFDARPTKGHCQGIYVWVIREGRYGDTPLNGLSFTWVVWHPGAVHEGNGTEVWLIDQRADEAQRAALETLARGDGVGPPFEILASTVSKRLGVVYAPIDVKLDGIRSQVKVGGGRICEIAMTRIRNPVTGQEEELYLDKPTGFTAKRSELGMSTVARVSADGLSFDVSGLYAEYAEFDYSGP
jgi:hypothetical protein